MAGGQGRVALVTGGARGIGLEVARQLAGAGMTVLLSARDGTRAEAAAAELGGQVRPLTLDVGDPASVELAAATLRGRPGRLDVLVNNAAAFADWNETASGADLEAAAATFDVNLFGPWRVTSAMLPLLRSSGHGRIVNVASGAGSHGDPSFGLPTNPGSASYAVAKAALLPDDGPSGGFFRDGQPVPW